MKVIERAFKNIVNGEVNVILRDRPVLKPGATPTIFDGYPQHLVKKPVKLSKDRNVCEQEQPPKKKRKVVTLDEDATGTTPTPDDVSSGSDHQMEETEKHPLEGICPPPNWSRVSLPSQSSSIDYVLCEADENDLSCLYARKMVRFTPSATGPFIASVYLRGVEKSEVPIGDVKTAELVLEETDRIPMCVGCPLMPFSENYVSWYGSYYSKRCTLSCESEGNPCIHCKYLRRLARN